jgi:hypothetical protein
VRIKCASGGWCFHRQVNCKAIVQKVIKKNERK